ncbi:MAG: hypothetical protein KDE51_26720, partial [Anaerolineales bacterium]|nr:hypothetical protein [Anaerolineales bacterium]
MFKRILFSIIGIAAYLLTNTISGRYYAIYQAEAAAGQLANDSQTAAQALLIVGNNWPMIVANVILFVFLLAVWGPFLWQMAKQHQKRQQFSKWTAFALGLFLVTTTAACKPYGATRIVEIKPNETAFLVPLIGDGTVQDRFQSVDFLEQKQVAAKQVEIPVREHKVGRMWWQIEWVPAAAVIIVDRTPVTREWTSANSTGTSTSNQAFGVESQESIDFKVGATCSALVSEENAAKFLYYFSGKSLAQVMDENIRGFVQAELFNEFGARTLEEGRQDKKEIFEAVFARTLEKFEPLGITITSLGGSEGLIYSDPKVQQVINDNFAAQQAQIQAQAQATAQAVENQTL